MAVLLPCLAGPDKILRFLCLLRVKGCMHPFNKGHELNQLAIGPGIEVHRLKGPGLIESLG